MAGRMMILRDEQGQAHRAAIAADGTVTMGDVAFSIQADADGGIRLRHDSNSTGAWAAVSGSVIWVFLDGEVFTFESERPNSRRQASAAAHGSLTAPMPATVRQIAVAPGDPVQAGDVLIVLEAMKMELPVRAPAAGTVGAVKCREGEMVTAGQELIEIQP